MDTAFITLAMCAAYLILRDLFPCFFVQKTSLPKRSTWISLVYIVILSTLVSAVSLSIQDLELSNRILHIFGGGFLGFFVCFLAARDSGVSVNKFQFFVFSTLLVTALGVANELFEFVLQEYGGIMSAATATDTWLDLASNTIGVILSSICFVPFHKENPIEVVDTI